MNVIYVGVSNKNLTFVKLPVNCNKLIRLLHTEHNEKSMNLFELPLWSSILLSLESDADDALASAIITKIKIFKWFKSFRRRLQNKRIFKFSQFCDKMTRLRYYTHQIRAMHWEYQWQVSCFGFGFGF